MVRIYCSMWCSICFSYIIYYCCKSRMNSTVTCRSYHHWPTDKKQCNINFICSHNFLFVPIFSRLRLWQANFRILFGRLSLINCRKLSVVILHSWSALLIKFSRTTVYIASTAGLFVFWCSSCFSGSDAALSLMRKRNKQMTENVAK